MVYINKFKKGIKDGLPICIGYFSVAFAFGIFATDSLVKVAALSCIGVLAAEIVIKYI